MAAIYQWFTFIEEEYVTTLYPAEMRTGVEFTGTLDGGSMDKLANDGLDLDTEIMTGRFWQGLLSADREDEGLEPETEIIDGDFYPGLETAPTQQDGLDCDTEIMSGTLDVVLITAYAPDQGLETSIDLESSGTYMTGV